MKQARQLQEQAEEMMRLAVYAERSSGASWEEIGKQLGVTRSTVHGRYAAGFNEWARGGRGSFIKGLTQLRRAWVDVEARASFQISQLPWAGIRGDDRHVRLADDGPRPDRRLHFATDSDSQTGVLHGGHHGELRVADDTSELPVDERLRRLESAVALLLWATPHDER
ncbi:hypothetical protein [Kitasatospora sp. NPDC058046]|uniref:hypothetical protein n=1 Tax=Kitasatospora sp. NPDC058046 TaxID=3346312 RepID=UPI0036DC0873